MPKKTDSTPKPVAHAAATPAAATPAPAPIKRAIKPAAKTKTGVKKPKAPAVKAKRTAKVAVNGLPAVASFTREDIALRAYFISEKRRNQGLTGDEHQDWIEAERQLLSESAKPKKVAKA